MTTAMTATDLSIGRLDPRQLDAADRICRVAFGTFVGVPEPETFFGDAEYVRTRFRARNTVALAAEADGELVGTNFVTRWGSFGFFGPLSVKVDLWDRGIASALMEATIDVFAEWGTHHNALFTWSDSAKHHGLYQKFGFYPTFLTAVMSKPVATSAGTPYRLLSQDFDDLDVCSDLAAAIYPGLDLSDEIRSVIELELGDIVVLDDRDGFAVCHVGSGTEAGAGTCFVKFGAVRPGGGAPDAFDRLLQACGSFAAERGVQRLTAGTSMGRLGAYRSMITAGFRTDLTGVAMQRGGEFGYNRPDVFAIDDWR
ncbi:MAG: GNAT family N-acetyltransferase [Actinomycetota bacterium]